jgi:glycosidase
VEMLCNGFANLIARNDSKGRRPSVGKAWYEDMRKMLDIDGFTVDELKAVIEWTQRHPKWSNWVKSPHKLRIQLKPEKNDLLGLMRAEQAKPQGQGGNARVQTALSVAEELDQEFGDGNGQMEIAA